MVNGPKTWSLAAALHPQIAAAYDAAQDRAAGEIIGWLAEHATTRVGPRGRQVQVPVEQLEAAVVRHYTSRAGDPHRHLHLQVNARVFAAGRWRGLHSVGVVDSIEALNGIGHAAIMCDPQFRAALAGHGYTLDPGSGEVTQLAPYAARFSARAAQIGRNVDRYEAEWRRDHPDQEPDARLRRAWDRRAWAQARPDKVVPIDGRALAYRWIHELHELGFTPPPPQPVTSPGTDTAIAGRGGKPARRSGGWIGMRVPSSRWCGSAPAGPRGTPPTCAARPNGSSPSWTWSPTRGSVGSWPRTSPPAPPARCVPLLDRIDVPEHVRALTSREVLAVETELVDRLTARGHQPARPARVGPVIARRDLDHAQRLVVAALTGTGTLVVVEGAAGAGKTTTLAAARELLDMHTERLVVVTPTLKAAHVATEETGADAYSAAWLAYQHGWRWDGDGAWTRPHRPPEGHYYHRPETRPDIRARLYPGDLLLIDEAGMLDQDTTRALLSIADETGARVAFLGDRHQLPAVGRGGVLDHAARAAPEDSHLALETVHRFTDPDYADLTLLMRTGQHPGQVFDTLHQHGLIALHPSDVERHAALTDIATQHAGTGDTADPADGVRIIADTREQVAALSAAIRDQRLQTGQTSQTSAGRVATTSSGEPIGTGDRVTTRRNDRGLGVANRDRWTVTSIDDNGGVVVRWAPSVSGACPATTSPSTWSWTTPPPCTGSRARPSTTPTSSSARPPAPPRRTSR